jgi:4-amino-4-deoxy-L-arabinose transferase-like glycosyltransferase
MGNQSSFLVKTQEQATAGARILPRSVLPYLILAIIILLFSIIRIRLASFPLERDEGEYAYFGQLILQGIPPYQMAYNLKFPGIYAVYAMIMAIFGQTTEGIRYGLLVFNLGSLCLIYLIMRRLFSNVSALAAAAIAGILFLSPNLLGQAAHATHFVVFFMLAGSWFLLEALERQKWSLFLVSGIMMGLSLLMKQSGVFFPIFGGIVIMAYGWHLKERKWKSLLTPLFQYGLGVAIPLLIALLVLSLCGVFDKFWFWAFVYPKTYVSRIPLSQAWILFTNNSLRVFNSFSAAWILAALGAIGLFLYRGKTSERIFLGLLLIASFLSVIPGFYFRPHYFIPMAPIVGMLAGFFLEILDQWIGFSSRFSRWIPALAAAALVLYVLNENKAFYFKVDPKQLCHILYQNNDFVEAVPIARYIEANSDENDRILVFGSEPEIYFYAKRKSATGYIYMYDLAFAHPYKQSMQKELMREVEKCKPRFMIAFSNPNTWTADRGELDALFDWFNAYVQHNKFVPVGLVNYRFPEASEFLWGQDALAAKPRSQIYTYILQRQN